ncbi:MAG: hypothetical protein H9806_00635 [Candidatus Lactobacillus pullistercoris]|uniref:Uncharacterized protein n=1 Tax=Candidatus Lactobacillus pullistercoris TaxID=2838636 RepID=A0A9E2KPG2_9LACO|nr:hypothetical protein [Candidatus Lactobacillus pullistercoris]
MNEACNGCDTEKLKKLKAQLLREREQGKKFSLLPIYIMEFCYAWQLIQLKKYLSESKIIFTIFTVEKDRLLLLLILLEWA